jgi:hypothetical protein
MNAKQRSLIINYARLAAECNRRNDAVARDQSIQEWLELPSWHWSTAGKTPPVKVYRLPDGGRTKYRATALDAWAQAPQ